MAEVTAMRDNVAGQPLYGFPWTVVFPILDADGDLVTGATGLDSEVSLNGDTFADCTNEATEIATSSGMYYLTLTALEMLASVVTVIVKTTSSGAKTTPMVFYPQVYTGVLRTGTAQAGSSNDIALDSGASALDDAYTGCVIAGNLDGTVENRTIVNYVGSTKTATVIPNWVTTPDSNDTFTIYQVSGIQVPDTNVRGISDDATAADNAEAFFDGTGYAGTNNVMPTTTTVTNRVTANTDQLAGQTVTAAAGVTFPTSVASPTNITAGTITTVTNLTNAPTSGDFTNTMKTSITTAATAATPTVAAVTGDVGGNLVGDVQGNVDGDVLGEVAAIGTGGISALSFAAGAIDAAAIDQDALDAIAVAVLGYDWDGFTGEADRSAINALRFLRNKWSIAAGTLTVTKEDDSTTAWTGAVTQTAGDPVSAIDPAGP